MWIPINRIIVNKQKVNEEHVDDFVEILERGRKVPPILVRKIDGWHKNHDKHEACQYCAIKGPGDIFVLVDGRHRLAAHKMLGKETIEVMVTL